MTLRSEDPEAVQAEIDRMTLRPPGETDAARPPVTMRHFTNLVVAVDGSEGADHALAWTLWLARLDDAKVHLVSVLGPPPYTFDSGQAPPVYGSASSWKALMDDERKEAEQVLAHAERTLADAGVKATTEVSIGSPASVISAIAESREADLVVCGSHEAGAVERAVLGSVADGLKHQAPCSVLIAKNEPGKAAVLLATDGSALSRSAVLTGARLARLLNAQAHLLHVVPASGERQKRLAKESYESVRAERGKGAPDGVRAGGLETEVAFGRPHEVICTRATELDARLIVMGSRGLGGLRGRLLGSVSNPVSHHATASVLFVKPEED